MTQSDREKLAERNDPLNMLEKICEEIFDRWDADQRSGKLLSALAGRLKNYRADVTEVREVLRRPAPVGLPSEEEIARIMEEAWDHAKAPYRRALVGARAILSRLAAQPAPVPEGE